MTKRNGQGANPTYKKISHPANPHRIPNDRDDYVSRREWEAAWEREARITLREIRTAKVGGR